MTTLLVANRGEIAVRIIATARTLGWKTIAVYAGDDATSLHVAAADEAIELPGVGPAAYLDIAQLQHVITDTGAQFVHPGYGFLAESPEFAAACAQAGAHFIGPSPQALRLAGDKAATADLARELDIPVSASTGVLDDAQPAVELLQDSPHGIALKAVAGGGGRGIAVVTDMTEVAPALQRCAAEAERGFGDGRVFAEQWFAGARHIEVQCVGDGQRVIAVGDRDCSLQRRRQKVIEIAPAAGLDEQVREGLYAAAEALLSRIGYASLATVEFLVTAESWVFLEINPRIQVEHTVTEEMLGVDLVAAQLTLAQGGQLTELALRRADPGTLPGDSAIEARIGAETISVDDDGVRTQPAVGTVTELGLPFGPGVRVDSWLQPGTQVGALYDSLLAKVTASGHGIAQAARSLDAALERTRIGGVETTLPLLRAIIAAGLVGDATTTSLDEQMTALLESAGKYDAGDSSGAAGAPSAAAASPAASSAGAPSAAGGSASAAPELEAGQEYVRAPLTGTVVSLEAKAGELGVIEAMKMHHPITAPAHERAEPLVAVGQTVSANQPLFIIDVASEAGDGADAEAATEHPGIAETQQRHALTADDARTEAVDKIHARGRRTARENLADLIVPGTFVEYGPLVLAAQRGRRSHADLVQRTSGDGLVGGIGMVRTPSGAVEAVVMSYDYMVLAGTQGRRNHQKTDRLIGVAEQRGLPIVLFAEGGGGRPGDTDVPPGAQLDVTTFAALAALRGRVPLVSIVSGRCFAGNAALAGVCDVIIATEDANIGMGGPAMIEGGGLGRFAPEEVGPAALHASTGAIDVLVSDDAAAVAAAQDYLGLVSEGIAEASAADGDSHDATGLDPRTVIPADRLRAFAMRDVISSVVDPGSFFEMRREHAAGAIVGFARVDGQPLGIIANSNHHLGGAIDVDAARSFTAHLRLVESMGLPLVSFVDTPGFMVGPEAEHEPGVRVFGDLFTAGAALSVPLGAIIVRKGYGLGAMAMTGGHFRSPQFTIGWPSGEIGPMGLEGAVRLGYAKELAAITDPDAQQAKFDELLAAMYDNGRAMSSAEFFDLDDVIDPADTRRWIATLF